MKTQAQYVVVAKIGPKELADKKKQLDGKLTESSYYRYDTKGYVEVTLSGDDTNGLQALARQIAVLLKPSLIKKSTVFTEKYQ